MMNERRVMSRVTHNITSEARRRLWFTLGSPAFNDVFMGTVVTMAEWSQVLTGVRRELEAHERARRE